MITTGVRQRSGNTPARFAKAEGQIIIFTTPADEVFIKTIHGFEIVARDSNIVAGELWFLRVPHPTVVLAFNSNFEQSASLVARGPAGKGAGRNCLLVDAVCCFFVESDAIAGANDSGPAGLHVLAQMVGRKNAVTIGEQEVRRAAGPHAVV